MCPSPSCLRSVLLRSGFPGSLLHLSPCPGAPLPAAPTPVPLSPARSTCLLATPSSVEQLPGNLSSVGLRGEQPRQERGQVKPQVSACYLHGTQSGFATVRLSLDKAGQVWTFVHTAQAGKLSLREGKDLHPLVQHTNHTWQKRKLGNEATPLRA